MSQQGIGDNPVTLGLIGVWVILLAITFVAGWSWIATSARKYRPGSVWVRAIMVRSIPVIFFHLVWATIIALSISAGWEGVACMWLLVLVVIAYAYTMHYVGYRRLRRMEEQALPEKTDEGQDEQ